MQKEVFNDESIVIESECNKSKNIHTNSGYFNSGESLNNDSVCQINNAHNEFSSTVNSLNNILNENISTDHHDTRHFCDLSSHIYFEESKLSSVNSLNDDFEDLENISFPSENLLADAELINIEEAELTADNTPSQAKNNLCSINSEWMTDVSGLSSYVGSDDYFTCPDAYSGYILNRKIDKIDMQFRNKVPAKLYEPKRYFFYSINII